MSLNQWQCLLCSAHFSRSEHLRRHLRSHENKRPYECNLCRRSFTRRDALKRHEKTCKPQSGLSDPSGSLFDPAQDGDTPDISRYFNEVNENDLLNNVPSPSDFASLDWLYSTRFTSNSIISAERLEYLAYFTSANGMRTFLDRETFEERQRLILKHEADISLHQPPPSSDSALGSFSDTIEPSMIHMDMGEIDPLTPRTYEIIHHFRAIITHKQDKDIVKLDWTTEVQESCLLFFSPSNISRFLGYFWSLWYPNCPIVHRSSFNPQTAPPALLCVMLIIGACLSPHPEDGRLARVWLDCVEELAFNDSGFQEESTTLPTNSGALDHQIERKKKRLECVQTAYLICSLQKREGSLQARGRIRRYRHATMVMLARDIGLGTASHRTLSMEAPSEAWWRQFAVEEGLVRTLIYVFLFDAALTIFHNSPPRMVVSELKMDMACPDASFQAASADECFAIMQPWTQSIFWRKRLSVVSVVRSICQHEPSKFSPDEYSQMGTLNLFTTVQALHSLTFHLQNSLIFESTLLPIKAGLKNWRSVWDKHEPEDTHIPDQPNTIWRKLGFVRYSPEFWHLARIIVDKIEKDNAHPTEDLSPCEQEQSPSRYDHNDMMDVNGLIMEYRRLSLGVTT